MPFGGLLTVGLIGGAGSLLGGLFGSNASENAAKEQTQQEQQGLDFQKQIWQQEQQNLAPFLSAGTSSIGQLMTLLGNGTFGPGSTPAFKAPTLSDAENQPGYQFSLQQGDKGILQGAAAAGGSISGGTIKQLAQFNQNLGENDYNNVFSQALAGYQQSLATQAQQFQQLLAPATIGVGATESLNNAGQATATNVGNIYSQIGNSQAAGTVGSANAWSNAFSGVGNSVTSAILLNSLLGGGGGTGGGGSTTTPTNPATTAIYPWQLGGAGAPPPLAPPINYGEGPG